MLYKFSRIDSWVLILSPTEQKGTRLEAWTSNNFDTLSKKEQQLATENNRADLFLKNIIFILQKFLY